MNKLEVLARSSFSGAFAAFLAMAAMPVVSQPLETLGAQRAEEQYDAPIIEADEPEPLIIDFNRLLEASTENDDVEVTESLQQLVISFSGATDTDVADRRFVSVKGMSRIPDQNIALPAVISKELEAFRAKPLTFGDLRKIKQVIIDAYTDIGYPLMSVVLPPQEVVDGKLRLTIHEFSLGQLNYQWRQDDGSYAETDERWTSDKNLRKTFGRLYELPVLGQADMSKAVEYMSANPYRTAKVVFEPGKNVDETNANVLIDEQRPWNLSGSYNNHATESSGTNRYSLAATLGNTPFEDSQLALRGTFGDNRQEFQSYSVIYSKPTRAGNSISLNGSYSDTASSSIPGISSASRTSSLTASFDAPLFKNERYQLSSTSSLSYRRFERFSFFGDTEVGHVPYVSVQATQGGSVSFKDKHASHKVDINVTASLKGITARNTNEDFRSFHNNSGDTEYFYGVVNYARQQDLSWLGVKGIGTNTQASWQQASNITAGSDNFSVGGSNVLKAYSSGEAAGDEGWYVTQDLSYPPPKFTLPFIQQLSLKNFVAVGRTTSNGNGIAEKLWDYGIDLSVVFKGGANCNMSMAWAGTDGVQTEKGQGNFFTSCSYRY